MTQRHQSDVRAQLAACEPREALGCIAHLLHQGGVSLTYDEPLLAHIDFWIAYDPLDPTLAELLARHLEEGRSGGAGTAIRWASGRIRDRVRASYVLGVARGIERSDELLEGLLRDSVPVIWLAAARSVWRRAFHHPELLGKWERVLRSADQALPDVSMRRHVAGGLAALVPLAPEAARRLIELSLDPAIERWTRFSAAIACAEAAVLSGGEAGTWTCQSFTGLYEAQGQSSEVLPSLALGLRNSGRARERREAAARLGRTLREEAIRWIPGNQSERVACYRTVRLVDGLCPGPEVSPSDASFSQGFETIVDMAAHERAPALAELLEEVLVRARESLAKVTASTEDDDEVQVDAQAALFHEVARLTLGEDLLPVLCEVVGATADEKSAELERASRTSPSIRIKLFDLARALSRATVETSLALCQASQFSLRREGARGVALAAEACSDELRRQIPLVFQLARDPKTRLQGVSALARLLDRLRVEDPEGFLELALRVALSSGKKLTELKRVTEASPWNESRSFLTLLDRAATTIGSQPKAPRILELIEDLERSVSNIQPPASSRLGTIQNLSLDCVTAVVDSMWYLLSDGAQGTIDRLPLALEVISRFERCQKWTDPLTGKTRDLLKLGRSSVNKEADGETLTTAELRSLADEIERVLKSFLAVALVRVLRAKARQRKRGPRRTSQAPVSPRPGAEIHGYTVVRQLHETSLSLVLLGLNAETRSRTIMKLPTARICHNPASREAFLREGELLRRLHSEHVVRVHEVFPGEPPAVPPMLAIEFLRGRGLSEHLGLPWQWQVARGIQILRGLQNVHDCGIVHRDVKPQNVMIVPSGRAVLIDFGIADFSAEEGRVPAPSSLSGTPQYMPPEQWKNQHLSPATDIYALGVTLYELVARKLPFEAASIPDWYVKHCNDEPPPLAAHLPESLTGIIGRMMAKRPEERPLHEEIRLALEESLAAADLSSASTLR